MYVQIDEENDACACKPHKCAQRLSRQIHTYLCLLTDLTDD